MDNAQPFLQWWKDQRDSDTAIYPDPAALTKLKHAKIYQPLFFELSTRWPAARRELFRLLDRPKKELASQVRSAAKAGAKWWCDTAGPLFIERVVEMARQVRLNPSLMEQVTRNPHDPKGAFGCFPVEYFECFAKDGGEAMLAPGTQLRSGLDAWVTVCGEWYRSVAKSPLALPPMVLSQRPRAPWGEVVKPGMSCTYRSPVNAVPLTGDFATPTGRASHDSEHWNGFGRGGSMPIFDCILGHVANRLHEERPTSLDEVANSASVNVWCVATALDGLIGIRNWHEDQESRVHDWFAQVEPKFDVWIRTRMGELLEFKQIPGAPPQTGHYIPAPEAGRLWSDAVPFFKSEQPDGSARATLYGFALDVILEHFLALESAQGLSTASEHESKRQQGREGQVMAIVKDHPDWNKSQVARRMGIKRYELSRAKGKLKRAWDSAQELVRRSKPKGWAKEGGGIEAIDGESE